MYGYRYAPTSPVVPMPRCDRDTAAEEVRRRRGRQLGHNNPATVELVEETDPGVWTPVDIEPVHASQPTGPRDPFEGLPIRSGHRRKRR